MNFEEYKNIEDLKKMPVEELPKFCDDLRRFITNTISKTGGHLGASLGVLELTVALHYVFNSPIDKIIWDIGHQAYPHKVLTGRKEKLHTIRKANGISGFANIFESEHDIFGAGHSSTSISAGLGIMASQTGGFVLPVIGDGAMSAGMAFEALNNASEVNGKMIIILNDNDMSISSPTGAISKYLPKLANSKGMFEIKNLSKKILPEAILSSLKKGEQLLKNSFLGCNIFESLGVKYYGPLDGHNILKLIEILEILREEAEEGEPILLHLKTQKGKGYLPAENSADKFHGVAPFCIETGIQNKSNSGVSFSLLASNALSKLATNDEKIFAITPAMKAGSCLEEFSIKFPTRFFDVGIAEQHAVTFSAGLARGGVKPYCFIYSTFLQRAYDQLIHDVALQNLPVRFIVDRAGVVGEDGATHNGVFDIAFARVIPNIIICSPSSKGELEKAIIFSASYEAHPFIIRIPRGEAPDDFISDSFEFGKGRMILEGKEKAIIGVGITAKYAFEKAQKNGFTAIDLRFIKPIDEALIIKLFKEYSVVEIIEDGSIGGVYSIILELCHKYDLDITKLNQFILPDQFLEHDTIKNIHLKYLTPVL